MNVIVGYAGGTTLSYSLNAFNAWEGYHIAFNGTKGRLEHSAVENALVAGASNAQGAGEGDHPDHPDARAPRARSSRAWAKATTAAATR